MTAQPFSANELLTTLHVVFRTSETHFLGCNHLQGNFPVGIKQCFSLLQIETHVEGQRVRYFQDDDSIGLKEMVRREKMSSAQDQNALYSRMAAKVGGHFFFLLSSITRHLVHCQFSYLPY